MNEEEDFLWEETEETTFDLFCCKFAFLNYENNFIYKSTNDEMFVESVEIDWSLFLLVTNVQWME